MENTPSVCKTGCTGLDVILSGGLPIHRMYLVEGSPGVGKTTLALQFLLQGLRSQEKCLYVTLSETREELDTVARSHGWTLDGLSIIELSMVDKAIGLNSQNTLFNPAEVELNQLSELLLDTVKRLQPTRVVLDSLSEMRLLAQNPLRYRRQILSLKQHFATINCTVMLLDDKSAVGDDVQVQSLVHGIIGLVAKPVKYGVFRRYLTVSKLRGVQYSEGQHDYIVSKGGLVVFPRLVAADHVGEFGKLLLRSGNKELDTLLGGGLHAGTSNLFMGPAGSGKSTIASMFAHETAKNGGHVLYYAFDENAHTLKQRAKELGIDFAPFVKSGILRVQQIDPATLAPGQLADQIMRAVERDSTKVVVLDSLNGYVSAMPQDDFLSLHLHELLTFLSQQGVMSIMIMAQHGLIGQMSAPVDVSYLADSVILLRFFEALGSVKKAISIIKKRSGHHETTIREMTMYENRVQFGGPLTQFEGVLSGIPRYRGNDENFVIAENA